MIPDERPYAQLQMIWPERLLASPPDARAPEGYQLRCFAGRIAGNPQADEAALLTLMHNAGFSNWSHEQLVQIAPSVLAGGHLVAVHLASGKLVASAMARHRPTELHPDGGELSWVAGDPEHKGKGLGMAICAAVVGRFLQASYRRIYLLTDDYRLPAIRIYLRLGFEPLLFRDDMAERWAKIRQQLA